MPTRNGQLNKIVVVVVVVVVVGVVAFIVVASKAHLNSRVAWVDPYSGDCKGRTPGRSMASERRRHKLVVSTCAHVCTTC